MNLQYEFWRIYSRALEPMHVSEICTANSNGRFVRPLPFLQGQPKTFVLQANSKYTDLIFGKHCFLGFTVLGKKIGQRLKNLYGKFKSAFFENVLSQFKTCVRQPKRYVTYYVMASFKRKHNLEYIFNISIKENRG